ncbi:helix-turn-helix domain-containing protein [Rhodococcus indonesiensis]|uniref:helix-turn-helix domain-containing protein n=1 Tax=Rhodococcus indonesiensis TaxID=3055869 RepID=UPI0039F70385
MPEQAWASRAVIERATGVLMERYRLDVDGAREVLLLASRQSGEPMQQLAEAVLGSGRGDEPTPVRLVLEAATVPPAVRRAVAFIESHAAQPIRLGDIAAAAGVGARALQYAFVRHYHSTPMRYLRSVRLERAHRQLRAGDPSRGETVAAIATRCGFSTPSRFATQYRTVYGRPPHRTLYEEPDRPS